MSRDRPVLPPAMTKVAPMVVPSPEKPSRLVRLVNKEIEPDCTYGRE